MRAHHEELVQTAGAADETMIDRDGEFGKKYDISEVTIARLRDGKPGMRSTINKLLAAFSEVYGRIFTVRNVRGIVIRGETQGREQAEEEAA